VLGNCRGQLKGCQHPDDAYEPLVAFACDGGGLTNPHDFDSGWWAATAISATTVRLWTQAINVFRSYLLSRTYVQCVACGGDQCHLLLKYRRRLTSCLARARSSPPPASLPLEELEEDERFDIELVNRFRTELIPLLAGVPEPILASFVDLIREGSIIYPGAGPPATAGNTGGACADVGATHCRRGGVE